VRLRDRLDLTSLILAEIYKRVHDVLRDGGSLTLVDDDDNHDDDGSNGHEGG
jgi:hypothetical protein